jgi:hypothetical protein
VRPSLRGASFGWPLQRWTSVFKHTLPWDSTCCDLKEGHSPFGDRPGQ